MHLALRFADPGWLDHRISDAALAAGIAVNCMTRHASGLRNPPWNGLLLGYSQVPVRDIDPAVQRLAQIARRHAM